VNGEGERTKGEMMNADREMMNADRETSNVKIECCTERGYVEKRPYYVHVGVLRA